MTMDELFRPHNLELVLNMAAFVLDDDGAVVLVDLYLQILGFHLVMLDIKPVG